MDFMIPEDLKQVQILARKFVQEELVPLEREVEETGEFPEDRRRSLREKAIKLGLYCYHAPAEYGGGGINVLGSVLIMEELGKVTQTVGMEGGIIGECREDWLMEANESQKKEYLLPFIRGEKEFFLGSTEPNAGSDTSSLETRALKKGNTYILNGNKAYITMAGRADFGLIMAITDPEKRARGGVTCFIVDTGTPGLSISKSIPMFGCRGQGFHEVRLENCVVSEEKILGEVGHGLRIGLRGLGTIRLLVASNCIGGAVRAQEMAVTWAKSRVTFGKPLAQRQTIQNMLLDNDTNIWAARMMVQNTAWEADQGIDVRVKAWQAKVFTSDMACKVVDDAMQIHGQLGYSKEIPLGMIYADLRVFRIAEGANELARHWLASRMLGVKFE